MPVKIQLHKLLIIENNLITAELQINDDILYKRSFNNVYLFSTLCPPSRSISMFYR